MYKCAACARRIRFKHGLCIFCVAFYGVRDKKVQEWPEDLHDLLAESVAYDRDPLSDPSTLSLEGLLEAGVQVDTGGRVYYPPNWVEELRDEDLLRLAPYETYAENVKYWRANNLQPSREARAMVKVENGEKAPRDPEKQKLSSEAQAVLARAYARAHKTKRIGPLDADHKRWHDASSRW